MIFFFGAEESYGYLIGTHARDKDAIVCSCLIAEIALDAKLQGNTLVDLLNGIYEKYGVFREQQSSITFKPIKEEIDKMQEIMRHLRENPPSAIAGLPVLYIEDYERKVRLTLSDAKIERLTLPQSDVLVLRLYDNSRIVIRPSGTEPKVKIYVSANSPPSVQLQAAYTQCVG